MTRRRLDSVTRWAIGLVLWVTACWGCGRPEPLAPLYLTQVQPPPIWQLWGQRAIDCARHLHGDSSAFTVLHDSVDVRQFTWLVVATEQADGGFPCRGAHGQVGSCVGEFRAPDSILVSAQHTGEEDLIAHEILHWAVESAGEKEWRHGPPWGLCEFL